MCEDVPSIDADSSSADAESEAHIAETSRRNFLTGGLALGAVALAPTGPLVRRAEEIVFVPDGGAETPGPEPTGSGVAAVAPNYAWPPPPIVTRAEWGADESRRAANNQFDFDSTVRKIVIHHTVTPNSANDASTVRGIYNYHTSTGYFDIAYNFLIGRDGRLYEGRWSRDYAPGVPHVGEDASGRNVRAAHSSATNTQTIGVALLGDYSGAYPTDPQLDMLTTFLAWKCQRWGLQPYATAPYLDGRVFPTICGHRDVTSTACPGYVMYSFISEMRDKTVRKMSTGTTGYWVIGADGAVEAFGDLPDLGDPKRTGIGSPIVDMAKHPTRQGYWAVAADGGIFRFGEAQHFGSMVGRPLYRPIVGMAATPSGNGYWMCAADGGVFGFGDAGFYGSAGNINLYRPIVGMAPTATGRGYWLVAADGGIFGYGDAGFYGSAGNINLYRPVVGMAATKTGRGYWLVAADGGIFGYGDAGWYGSAGAIPLYKPVVGMSVTPSGNGYHLFAADGGVFGFGDARFVGASSRADRNAVGFASSL